MLNILSLLGIVSPVLFPSFRGGSAAARKAIGALNGKDLKGRAAKVNEAQPMTDRPRGGFGKPLSASGRFLCRNRTTPVLKPR
jgi:hypothetical protein